MTAQRLIAFSRSRDFPFYFSRQLPQNNLPAIFPVKNRPSAGAQFRHEDLRPQQLEFIRVHSCSSVAKLYFVKNSRVVFPNEELNPTSENYLAFRATFASQKRVFCHWNPRSC
jgi:hypothetical protein